MLSSGHSLVTEKLAGPHCSLQYQAAPQVLGTGFLQPLPPGEACVLKCKPTRISLVSHQLQRRGEERLPGGHQVEEEREEKRETINILFRSCCSLDLHFELLSL